MNTNRKTTKVIPESGDIAVKESEHTITGNTEYTDPDFGPSGKLWSNQVPDIAKSNNINRYPSGYIIEPPTDNPAAIYNSRSSDYPLQQEFIPEKYGELPPNGQGNDRLKSLEIMKDYFTKQKNNFIGYQCAVQQDTNDDISEFLNISLNNAGDPFKNGYYTINAKQAERGVLDFFASLWHAQWPSLPKPKRDKNITDTEYYESYEYKKYKESYWGYVLSMGCTEGNLYAVLSARDYLSGYSLVVDDINEKPIYTPKTDKDTNPNKYTPVAFYSEASHYSFEKAVHVMQMKTFYQIALENGWQSPIGNKWSEAVPVDKRGSIIIDDLVTLVKFFADKGYAPFICFNYGTTFKGAYDNVSEACKRLKPIFEANNLINREVLNIDSEGNIKKDYRRGYWIHVDGALGASLMPFVEMAVENNKLDKSDLASCFDFRIDEVMSIVTSGHKWLTTSPPTGIYMSKNRYRITPVATPDYIGSPDTTFAGSRNGLSTMILWNLIAKIGINGFAERSVKTMQMCKYTEDKLKDLQKKLNNFNIWLHRAPNGGTSLIFRKPVDRIMFKYSMPIETEIIRKEEGVIKRTYAHLFILWDRSKQMIDSLINDLSEEGAFGKPEDTEVFIPYNKTELLNRSLN
jgi:histidine decarboxylase